MMLKKVILFFLVCGVAVGFAFPGDAGTGFDEPPVGSYYFIKSVQAGRRNLGYWDQPGYPRRYKRGHNIQAWAKDGKVDQAFRFLKAGRDWYYIQSKNGGFIDVSGGRNGNGVNIQVYSRNRLKPQKFRFKHLGKGRWKIYTWWGRVICLDGRRHRNGSNIHTWADHNGPWMEWYFIDSRSRKKYAPATGIKGKLTGHDYKKNGRRYIVSPGSSKIEVWYMDRSDRKNPYKKKTVIRTVKNGEFNAGDRFNDFDDIFLLSKNEGRSSAFITLYPKRKKTKIENFISEKSEQENYVLVDTMYRGKQYYYARDSYYYRKNGKVTRRQNFYFPNLDRVNKNNYAVRRLLKDIGGSRPARSDDDIARRIESVFAFVRTKTKSAMGSRDPKVRAANDYFYKNCRTRKGAPLRRWPSFQEMADTYQRFGFIPKGNCTSNSQIAASLLYMAGVPADKFFVAKFHYDMSWYVEHWVLAVNIGKRWYSLDPQHANVIRLKSAKDFTTARWERYIAKRYDYKKPFEAYLLPGSSIQAVPYVGDPSEIKSIAEALNKPVFFLKNKSFAFSSGGMEFRSRGRAEVMRVSGNLVYLKVDAVLERPGPKGMIKKHQKYNLTVEFNSGRYSTGKGYVHSGRVNSTGSVLDMSGEQSSMRFTVQ